MEVLDGFRKSGRFNGVGTFMGIFTTIDHKKKEEELLKTSIGIANNGMSREYNYLQNIQVQVLGVAQQKK